MVLKTLRQKIDVLVGEDRGVSPVIGVILMVAITVILAAVIGAFVLGLGDDLGNGSGPQAQLSFDYDDGTESGTESLVITHNGGNGIENAELRGDLNTANIVSSDGSADDFALSAGESVTFTENGGDEFSSGDTVNVVIGDNVVGSYEIP